MSDATQPPISSADGPGPSTCGPYRLVRLLGSGGMGAVYLGERIDGEVQQRVAIKLLRAGHKPAWRDRFLVERQLLASLDHPSIVRVTDAGHTADGHPYLVMEYVDGLPIDAFTAALPLRERLLLFLRVCDGLAHAHQHLIVHRDLKPSNILVDASGHPKLLDFGIAKLLDDTTADTGVTHTGEWLLTPDYASPEQMRGAAQTTATDIYSLGAVLFKLLTGSSPHQFYPTQSRVTGKPHEFPAASKRSPNLPGDLNHILAKALRADPDERYSSVESFADDLRAFLDSRPVKARSGHTWYRLRKFVLRHWIQASAAALVVASMTAGLIMVQEQRRVAERRFADIRGLAAKLLDLESEIRETPGTLEARKYIVAAVVRSLDELSTEVRDDLGLRIELATAYRRVADVQARRARSSFGLYPEALASLQKAESLLKGVRELDPKNQQAADDWFAVESETAQCLYDLGEREKGTQKAAATAEQLSRYLASAPGSLAHETTAMQVYSSAARLLLNGGQTTEALQYSERTTVLAIARAERLGTLEAQFLAASRLRVHGTAQRYAGELEHALESFDRADSLLAAGGEEPRFRRERQEIAYVRGLVLGESQGLSLGRFAAGAASLKIAADILHAIIAADPSDAEARVNLAQTSLKLGEISLLTDPRAALGVFSDGLQTLASAPDKNRYVAEYRVKLELASSIALAQVGKLQESHHLLEEAQAKLKTQLAWPPQSIGATSESEALWRARAEIAVAEGRTREAVAIYQDALRLMRTAGLERERQDLDNGSRVSQKLARIAALLEHLGDDTQAAAYRRERLELWRHWKNRLPANPFVQRQLEAADSHPGTAAPFAPAHGG